MSYSLRAAQALALCSALLLSACSSPSSDDMYRGERKPVLKATPTPKKDEKAQQNAQRLALLRDFGLDHQADPAKLVGLDGFDIKQLLGQPDFLRKDSGVEIWQYKAENCILDLFLYQKGGHFQVDHADLRGSLPRHGAANGCFDALLMGQK